jgi:hypothetical protein
MHRFRVLLSVTLALGSSLTANFARSQTSASASSPPLIETQSVRAPSMGQGAVQPERGNFQITSNCASRWFEVRTGNNVLVARCIGSCRLFLPNGSYRLVVPSTGVSSDSSLEFEVNGPGSIMIDDPNPTVKNTGLVLGISGPVLILAGTFLVASGTCINECPENTARQNRAIIGLGTLAAGIVSTIVGWKIYSHARNPQIHQQTQSTLQVGVAPSRGGGLLAVVASF